MKLFKAVIVSIVLSSIHFSSFAQNEIILSKQIIGKKINTSLSEEELLLGSSTIEQDNVSIEYKTKKNQRTTRREITTKSKGGRNFLNCSIERIQESLNLGSEMIVDTDAPFSPNVMQRMAVEHYSHFIKNPIIINFDENGKFTDRIDPKLPIKAQFGKDFPKLSPIAELSGIWINIPHNLKTWSDTLYNDDKTGRYINSYSIIEESSRNNTIMLNGIYESLSKPIVSTESVEKEIEGGIATVKTTIISINYEGTMIVDNKKNGFIDKVILTASKRSVMAVMGQKIEKNTKVSYIMINEMK